MPDDAVTPEEVAHRRFSRAFRGYDPGEVSSYLERVAKELKAVAKRERDLQRRLAETEYRAAHPVVDESVLTRSLGEETSRILANTQDVARELRSKAEKNAARILQDAHAEAQQIRAQAEVVLAERTEEAEAAASEIRATAQAEVESMLERAREESTALVSSAEAKARQLVEDAETTGNRVVTELTRRRRIAHSQVEQLRAGRERLLEAYRVVRATLDEVVDELQRAEPEARLAAEDAARRVAVEAGPLAGEVEVEVGETPLAALEAEAPAREADVLGPLEAEEQVPIALSPPLEADDDAPTALSSPPEATSEAEPELEAGPVPEAAPADAEPSAEPAVDGAEAKPPPGVVDELFARIRADRAGAVVRAREVLASEETGTETPSEPSPEQPTAAGAEEPTSAGDKELFRRRDTALEGIVAGLARKLKRGLQDEQNEVLDRLRSERRPVVVSALLPAEGEQASRYQQVAVEPLGEAALAGAGFTGQEASVRPDVDDLAAELAEAVVGPLRRRLAPGLEGEQEEQAAALARISAAYREWKNQRVDEVAADGVIAAFSRGFLRARPGESLRWVVDLDGGPCPDCYDNALAGPTSSGQDYPTGHRHPPAHAGCRCLLALATP